MEKRKPRGSIANELALAKSAAWAWLEHGFGSDRRPVPEFDVLRTKFDAKPSRYKVEAMKKVEETSNSTRTINVCRRSTSSTISITGGNSNSLLDRYEIERISRQLDYYIEASHANCHGGDHGGRRVETVAVAEIKSKSGLKKKVSKGHAVVCGSSTDEVVNRTSVDYSRRRRPEKGRVAVVELVGCRPRQGIRA